MQAVTEKLPLMIGRQSSGEAHTVNLVELPNLFISHSLDMQLPSMFISFIDQLTLQDPSILFSLSLSSRMAVPIKLLVPASSICLEYLHDHSSDGGIYSIDEFINALKLELKSRQAFYRKKTDQIRLPAMIVIIDDIFEVIMSSNKKTSLNFIELLMTASVFNMYFIMGSSGIYRNLLEQIINVTPSLKKKLNRALQSHNISQPLGAELVLNPDGLLFFREQGEKVYNRLFPHIERGLE